MDSIVKIEKEMFLDPTMITLLYTLGFGGMIWSIYYYMVNIFQEYFYRQFVSKIEISNQDPLYDSINKYLEQEQKQQVEMNTLTASLKRSLEYYWQDSQDIALDLQKPQIRYEHNKSGYYIKFQNQFIWIQVNQEKSQKVGYMKKEVIPKTLVLQSFNKSSIENLKQFCQKSLDIDFESKKDKIDIYYLHRWGGWRLSQSKEPRAIKSVVLDTNVAEQIQQDIVSFMNNEQWYKQRGVPYHRGYLLYGPPGSGKTSFITAIAGHLKLSICLMSLQSEDLTEESLISAFEQVPGKSIVLLEDVDAIFVQRTQKLKSKVSFSALLNALDGVRTAPGRILFMTTNHKEKLDPALLRPGRADVQIELQNASKIQIQNLFMNFYGGDSQQAEKFSKRMPEYKLSMAKLQGHFLLYKDLPHKAIENYKQILDEEKFDVRKLSVKECSQNNNENYHLINKWFNEIYQSSIKK